MFKEHQYRKTDMKSEGWVYQLIHILRFCITWCLITNGSAKKANGWVILLYFFLVVHYGVVPCSFKKILSPVQNYSFLVNTGNNNISLNLQTKTKELVRKFDVKTNKNQISTFFSVSSYFTSSREVSCVSF